MIVLVRARHGRSNHSDSGGLAENRETTTTTTTTTTMMMMMMKTAMEVRRSNGLAILSLLLASAWLPPAAHACSCLFTQLQDVDCSQFDLVFVATVVSPDNPTSPSPPGPGGSLFPSAFPPATDLSSDIPTRTFPGEKVARDRGRDGGGGCSQASHLFLAGISLLVSPLQFGLTSASRM